LLQGASISTVTRLKGDLVSDSTAQGFWKPTQTDSARHPNQSRYHRSSDGCDQIIGQCPAIQSLYGLIEKVADSDSTILINGETGTGKGVVARAIHQASYRKRGSFVSINCGAIPEHLLESELFGHVRGAFTGACSDKPGKFQMAHGGTLFLDEIGDMSPHLQIKLLKVLEESEFEQVGGNKTIQVNVRIIAATHRDLDNEIQRGRFRQDLYYRLYVIPIFLPPLRDRCGDIPLLVSHFLDTSSRKNHKRVTDMSPDALDQLSRYPWPGNIRELKNLMERLVVLKDTGGIELSDLPAKIKEFVPPAREVVLPFTDDGICLNAAVTEFEKTLIIQTLQKTQWVKKQAAQLLHLNRTTLVEKIKRHRIQPCAA
jgi:transcriptional regulator with GAF, ATPase, and Fis domain